MAHAGHHHAPASFGKAFAIGIALNLLYVVVEGGYGFLSHSLSLLADAGHNLSDVLGLFLAWGGAMLTATASTPRRTYGYRRSSILAALGNALLLVVAIGAIGWEAIRRFTDPEPVGGATVMIVAAIGIVVNGVTAWLFASGRHGDLNIRGAFLHMAADALVSVGVVIAGLLIYVTGALWIDPLASLLVVGVVGWSTWALLRESINLAVDAVPEGIDPDAVETYLREVPEVRDVHHVHIWALSTTEVALTAHLVCPHGVDDEFFARVGEGLHERFEIEHPTLQVEPGDGCADR